MVNRILRIVLAALVIASSTASAQTAFLPSDGTILAPGLTRVPSRTITSYDDDDGHAVTVSPTRGLPVKSTISVQDGDNIIPLGIGRLAESTTYHVREAFIIPAGQSAGDLESVLQFDNVTTVCLTSSPIFTHNGASSSYTYHADRLCEGVTTSTATPAITWNTDHFEMPLTTYTVGGHDFDGLWIGGSQPLPPLEGAIFFDADFPDPGFQNAVVASDLPDLPPSWGNPVTVAPDGTTQDFDLWLVEFDFTNTVYSDQSPDAALPVNFAGPQKVKGIMGGCTYYTNAASVADNTASSELESGCPQPGCSVLRCINGSSKAVGVRVNSEDAHPTLIPANGYIDFEFAEVGQGVGSSCFFDTATIAPGQASAVGVLGCVRN